MASTSVPRLDQPAVFSALEGRQHVLLAGCGGGFDVYSCIPLYFSLRSRQVDVHLANLTFTHLDAVDAPQVTEDCIKVSADGSVKSRLTADACYFPEFRLTTWFKEKRGLDVPIYTFARSSGAVQLAKAYEKLAEELKLDAIVIVDGGTDSLMLGNEQSLGTPVEDSTSMSAVMRVKTPSVRTKLLLCLGFGIDAFHGVCHSHFLENVARLSQDGGFLGAFSVTQQMEEGRALMEAYDFAKKHGQDSIVVSSVASAIAGHFGNFQSSPRTAGSELYINPLMGLYWCFRLESITKLMPHMAKLMETKSSSQVGRVIAEHQRSLKTLRPHKNLPL